MFSISSSGRRVSRRTVLRVGSLALGAFSLSDYLCCRARGAVANSQHGDTAVIHVFMGGGPSHIDLYDLKPDAPAEVRGEFRPISTSVPGVQISEHLPHLSRVMDRIALVRSITHGNASHLPASHWMMTGYNPGPSTTTNINPYCGAVAARLRGSNADGMPPYVSIPRRQLLGGPAFLGAAYNPFITEGDPNAPDFAVRNLAFPEGISVQRLGDRQRLLRRLDRMRGTLERQGQFAGLDRFSREALSIITSPAAAAAFDLKREPSATRDCYGRTSVGQSCLLARRLVESGVTFATVLSGGQWDTHTDNFGTLKKQSLPPVDRALAALVADLSERGLDRHVMLLVSGEFGRTPNINPQAGRDHWPGAFSVWFAGGGLRVGQVVGATDQRAMHPVTHPYSPGDVLATVYQFLGIDTSHQFVDRAGRPMRVLPDGRPINELVA